MRTEKAEGPQEPGNNRRGRPGARPKRASGGAVGFGNVMRDVKGAPGREGGEGGGGASAGGGSLAGGNPQGAIPGVPGFDPAMLQAAFVDPGAAAARAMGAIETVTQEANDASYGVRDATEALRDSDAPTAQLLQQAQQAQSHAPTPIVRMTPSALIETVLDESTKLEIERASRDLHIELEPEALGPLIVHLRKDERGKLDITFRARQGDAARVLEQGTELLRDRLAEAGFTGVGIDVRHEDDLTLR